MLLNYIFYKEIKEKLNYLLYVDLFFLVLFIFVFVIVIIKIWFYISNVIFIYVRILLVILGIGGRSFNELCFFILECRRKLLNNNNSNKIYVSWGFYYEYFFFELKVGVMDKEWNWKVIVFFNSIKMN